MNQNKSKAFRFFFAALSVIMLLTSMMSIGVFAQKPVILPDNHWHTACFNYYIRGSQSNTGTQLEYVNKAKNRHSTTATSANYAYSTSIWYSIATSSSYPTDNGFARSDLICPKDRCYKVNASSGINVRTGVGTDKPIAFSIGNGIYLEVMSLYDSGNWCRVRVRTGSYEGSTGYVASANIVQVNNLPSNS